MRKFIISILVFVIALSLFGCATQEEAATPPTTQEQTPEEKMAESNFIDIVERDPYDTSSRRLVYDSETHIVYYYLRYSYSKTAAAYLCPYYSANGYLCRYNTESQQIEEIIH